MPDFDKMRQEGMDLTDWWANGARVPRLPEPLIYEWSPSRRLGRHAIIAWTPGSLEPSNVTLVADALAEFAITDLRTWRRQYCFSDDFLGQFFGAHRTRSMMDMITITPRRTPRMTWPSEGRPALRESMEPVPCMLERDDELLRIGMVGRHVLLRINGMHWVPRLGVCRSRLRPGILTAQRLWEGTSIMYRRLCLVDPEQDRETLVAGSVPAVSETVDPTELGPIVENPMVQFFRLLESGVVELYNFGTSRGSGLLTDIRWATPSFGVMMRHSPEFAAPFRLVASKGRCLRRA